MKIKHFLIICISLINCWCVAGILDWLVFTLPESDYKIDYTNRQTVLLDVWQKEDNTNNRTWVDNGWIIKNYNNDTTQPHRVYCVSILQIKRNVTQENLIIWSNIFSSTNLFICITNNISNSLNERNLR